MSSFNNLKMRNKLFAMLTLPLLGLLVLSVWGLVNKKQEANEMAQLQSLAGLAVKISAVVHETQKERGATALFIGSNGEKFNQELREQRVETDKKIAALRSYLETFNVDEVDNAFSKKLSGSMSTLSMIKEKRKKINYLSLNAKEAIAFYTNLNGSFLGAISTITNLSTNPELSMLLVSYVNFLQGKERAGIERAVLSNTFANGYFLPGMSRKFGELVAAQNTYFDNFNSFAPEKLKSVFRKKLHGDITDEVNRMRNLAFEHMADKDQFGVEAEDWFKTKTAEINRMKQVENEVNRYFLSRTSAIESNARSSFNILVILVLLFISITIYTALSASKKIERPLLQITEVAEKVSNGDLEHEVDYTGNDEIGLLANAFRQLIQSEQEKANVALNIAQGNLNVEFVVKSKMDVLGNAMLQMKQALQEKAEAMSTMVQNLKTSRE